MEALLFEPERKREKETEKEYNMTVVQSYIGNKADLLFTFSVCFRQSSVLGTQPLILWSQGTMFCGPWVNHKHIDPLGPCMPVAPLYFVL